MSTWSESLRSQTRDAISEMRVNPSDGRLHLKNQDRRHAFMTVHDLLGGRIRLTDKESGAPCEFADVNELINAGWVID